jgi:TolA-binding protein
MLGAYDIYVKYVKKKDDKELPKIMYHRAKLMMIHNKFEEAKPLLEEIVTKFDGVPSAQIYAAWCSEMLLALLTIRRVDTGNTPEQTVQASDDLEVWAKKFQKMKVWNHPEADELKKAVPTLLAGIGWKKGMAYRDAGAAFVNGEAHGDADGFKKCADQFIAVYNDYEEHDRADTLLWNAADCLDAAYMVGKAIQIRKILLDRHPDSKHAKDTLHYLAGSYQAVAYYDDAAQRYEEFASTYAKDDRSPDALQNAYLFRLGLGEDVKAAENLKKYEGVYKKKNPSKAAKIFWSRADLIKEDSERRKHAEDYLKTYGAKGGKDRQAVAEAVIAQIEWRRSCEKDLVQDSCMTIKRKRVLSGVEEIEKRKKLEARQKRQEEKEAAKKGKTKKKTFKPPKRCGSATQGIITVHKRDKKRSDAAQKRFTKILKLAGKGDLKIPADDLKRADDFRNAWGMAMVYKADQDYEEYMTLKMPEGLDFTVEEYKKDSGLPKWEKEYAEQVKKKADSEKKFGEFFEKKKKLSDQLTEQYAKVKVTKSPAWVLAAAARSASVQQNFSDQLYRAEVPQSFKTQEQVWAYCDALADFAQPLQEQALNAFTYCIERSTQFQYFNEFSRLCEDEMQQRDADRYPATNESFGISIYTASKIEHVDVITDPEGGRKSSVKRKKKTEGDGEGKEEKSED